MACRGMSRPCTLPPACSGACRRAGAANARQPCRPRSDPDSQVVLRLGRVRRNAAHHELSVLLAEDKSGLSMDRHGEVELRSIGAESEENERLAGALQALPLISDRTARNG